jgi:hypothetical protein
MQAPVFRTWEVRSLEELQQAVWIGDFAAQLDWKKGGRI